MLFYLFMKHLLIVIILICSNILESYACCAEKDYRILPIGEVNKELVFLEFDLNRNCKPIKNSNELTFTIKGYINLLVSEKDSFNVLMSIDTIEIIECECSYKDFFEKTTYETQLGFYFQKAIEEASKIKGFEFCHTKEIVTNDTINTKITEEEILDNEFSYIVKYKDLFEVNLAIEDIISCFPDKIVEVRHYESKSNIITILRLRCNTLTDKEEKHIRKRFNNIKTAFWKEQAQWHGISKDYLIFKKKE